MVGRKRKLAYIGGHGGNNLGDETMWEAARQMFKSRLATYTYLAKERRLNRLALSGDRFFSGVCLGGGTLINPYYWQTQVEFALSSNLPVFAFGTGIGSCGFGQDEAVTLHGWPELLNRFVGIGLRGPLSQERATRSGVEGAVVIGDLALAATPDIRAVTKNRRISFNAAGNDWEHFSILAQLLEKLQRKGYEIVGVAMHPDDVAPIRHVGSMLSKPLANVSQPRDADEFFAEVAPTQMMLAIRLHASVLSAAIGVPPLLFAYRDKCVDFARSLGWERGLLFQDRAPSAREAEEACFEILANVDLFGDQLHNGCLAYRKRLREFAEEIEMVSL